jgi:hypothetical protein
MTYDLICEGRCNPGLAGADRLVAIYTDCRRLKMPFAGFDHMVSAQRLLKHTPHVPEGGDCARCLYCGTERQFGGRFWTAAMRERFLRRHHKEPV